MQLIRIARRLLFLARGAESTRARPSARIRVSLVRVYGDA